MEFVTNPGCEVHLQSVAVKFVASTWLIRLICGLDTQTRERGNSRAYHSLTAKTMRSINDKHPHK